MSMKIQIEDDFDLIKIINSGQCFRPCEISEGLFRFITKDKVLFIKPHFKNEFEISCDKDIWERVWIHYFDLNSCYRDKRAEIPREDSFMTRAGQMGSGIRILNQDYFETLISFIISQRKSIPAIRTSIEAICDIYGKTAETEYGRVKLFPTSKDIEEIGYEELAKCSLGYRLPYITEVIRDINAGILDLDKLSTEDDESLMSGLMAIKGVGIKVASCVALFAYSRGALAPVDVWIDRVINNYYGGINPFPGFGSNSGIYQQYAFYLIKSEGAMK